MKKFIKNLLIVIFLATTACAGTFDSVKEGLTGQKRKSTDEFLVKKKDPLVLPPGFYELPSPGQGSIKEKDTEEKKIGDILKIESNENFSSSQKNKNIEQSILKNINSN